MVFLLLKVTDDTDSINSSARLPIVKRNLKKPFMKSSKRSQTRHFFNWNIEIKKFLQNRSDSNVIRLHTNTITAVTAAYDVAIAVALLQRYLALASCGSSSAERSYSEMRIKNCEKTGRHRHGTGRLGILRNSLILNT